MTGSAASSVAADSTSADGDVVFPAPSPVATPAPSPTPSSTFRAPVTTTPPAPYEPHAFKPPGSASDCGSKSGSKETPEQQLERRRTTGSCGFYPNKFKECAEPRSCYDCLNFVVKTEEGGCMVSEYGRCVPARREYRRVHDFRCAKPSNPNTAAAKNATANSTAFAAAVAASSAGDVEVSVATTAPPADTWWLHFRAGDVRYCERTDPLCTECRRSVFADYIEGLSKSGGNKFCYGERGCVCVATCEARRDNPPPPKDCYAKALAANDEKKAETGVSGMSSVFMILGAMAFVVVTVFAIYRIRTSGERRNRGGSLEQGSGNSGAGNGGGDASANAVTTPESGSSPSNTTMVTVTSTTSGFRLLNLFGWQAMREDLINKEHMRFAGVENSSPVKHSNVQFLGVEPSAPEIDTAVPSAPMAAMAIPVPMAVLASAPVMYSMRAMASAPDFEDLDEEFEVL